MSVFGWCSGPNGSYGNHGACPYEVGSSAGIVRCGCGCHDEKVGTQSLLNESVLPTTVSGEGHPRGNGDGPQARTTRLDREGATPMLGVPNDRNLGGDA